MTGDPLVDEVRETRREISRECEHDIWKLYARYEAVQKQMKAEGKWRIISQPPASLTHEVSKVTSGG